MDTILEALLEKSQGEGKLRTPKKIAEQYSPEGKMSAWVAPLEETKPYEKIIREYNHYMVTIAKDAIQLSADVLEEAMEGDDTSSINDVTISTFYKHEVQDFVVKIFYHQTENNDLGILAVIKIDNKKYEDFLLDGE